MTSALGVAVIAYNGAMLHSSRVEDHRPNTSRIKCPQCSAAIEYWHTSGMSECYPHFYCNTCSNVLCREQDHAIIRDDHVDITKVMPGIMASLPRCKCGGQYTLDAGPKCPACGYEFKQQIVNLELRATEPHAILIAGAEMLTER